MRFLTPVLGVALLTACRGATTGTAVPTDAAQAASAAAPVACTQPLAVRTQIHGAFEGSPQSGLKGPVLVVAMAAAPSFGTAGRSFGTVADLELEEPRFAAEYAPDDLCSDDGSTPERIAIRCITGPSAKVTTLTVTRDGAGLSVSTDGKVTRWDPPAGSPPCFDLRGLSEKRDLESLRKTWMHVEHRCVLDSAAPPQRITLKLERVVASGDRHDAKVTLLGAGAPRSLGTMTNMAGAVGVRRMTDVNGITVSASDMGVNLRFVYQLGDRIHYVAEDGRIHAADVPCGARAMFEVRAMPPLDIRELR